MNPAVAAPFNPRNPLAMGGASGGMPFTANRYALHRPLGVASLRAAQPNPVANTQAPQQPAATAAGVQQAAQKLAWDSCLTGNDVSAQPTWMLQALLASLEVPGSPDSGDLPLRGTKSANAAGLPATPGLTAVAPPPPGAALGMPPAGPPAGAAPGGIPPTPPVTGMSPQQAPPTDPAAMAGATPPGAPAPGAPAPAAGPTPPMADPPPVPLPANPQINPPRPRTSNDAINDAVLLMGMEGKQQPGPLTAGQASADLTADAAGLGTKLAKDLTYTDPETGRRVTDNHQSLATKMATRLFRTADDEDSRLVHDAMVDELLRLRGTRTKAAGFGNTLGRLLGQSPMATALLGAGAVDQGHAAVMGGPSLARQGANAVRRAVPSTSTAKAPIDWKSLLGLGKAGGDYTFDREDCPKCGVLMEGDSYTGTCNACQHHFGIKKEAKAGFEKSAAGWGGAALDLGKKYMPQGLNWAKGLLGGGAKAAPAAAPTMRSMAGAAAKPLMHSAGGATLGAAPDIVQGMATGDYGNWQRDAAIGAAAFNPWLRGYANRSHGVGTALQPMIGGARGGIFGRDAGGLLDLGAGAVGLQDTNFAGIGAGIGGLGGGTAGAGRMTRQLAPRLPTGMQAGAKTIGNNLANFGHGMGSSVTGLPQRAYSALSGRAAPAAALTRAGGAGRAVGLGAGGLLGGHMAFQGAKNAITEHGLQAAEGYLNEKMPQMADYGEHRTREMLQNLGLLNDSGQVDMGGMVTRGMGHTADRTLSMLGLHPETMSPLQKLMLIGGGGTGATGLATGNPLLAGAGGASMMASLLPQVMQSLRHTPTPGQPGAAGPAAPVNAPGARNEYQHLLQMTGQ